ncbi:M23 family metallopeptidase [Parvularcula maris]|uniref:M23 family metallopeptidase n=1 Tax=Parvularcula maris TaxID=2965077 RepID=A0A9X2RIC7_9PROT|nr:M23 family metallopeptidase [Parvularcula maris]MCQ8184816.1 M23 family metallopeptidase [Parvularcula maris]
MYRWLLTAAPCLFAVACAQTPPPPSLSPTKEQAPAVTELPPVEDDLVDEAPAEVVTERVSLTRGRLVQAGLSFWVTEPGTRVTLDGDPVAVDSDGHFALGFGRDYEGRADIVLTYPDGTVEERKPLIGEREFPVSRIDNLDPAKVNPYTEEQLSKIRADQELKRAARADRAATSYWRAGWDWPVRGRISGKMGAQRILNGDPKRPHSGTDIAAPVGTSPMDFQGTDIRAPSTGKITLAESDMYFEGGLIFIDHGQGIESAMLHLSRVDVKPGQIVTKGEVIGAVGMTGRATGPHLHWTVNYNGTPVDPELLVPPMLGLQR